MKPRKFAILLSFILSISIVSPTLAASIPPTSAQNNISVYISDKIVYKYRTYNGVLQYRRWNETKKCWVDPYWINV